MPGLPQVFFRPRGTAVRILNIDGLYLASRLPPPGGRGPHPGQRAGVRGVPGPAASPGRTGGPAHGPGVRSGPGLLGRCLPPALVWWDSRTFPAVTIGYSIDSYCNPWHIPYGAAFDAVLAAQKDYVRLFEDTPVPRPSEWLPLFADPGPGTGTRGWPGTSP